MRYNSKSLQNERGFTLIELMIAAAIGVLALGVAISIFTTQQTVLKKENAATNLRAKGRHAIKVLTQELKEIGLGLPTTQGLVAPSPAANSPTITYRANLDNTRATTPPSATNGGTGGVSSIAVVANGTAFSSGDKIAIYNPSYGQSELNTVSGTPSSTSIGLLNALATTYSYGAQSRLVTINKYNNVVIDLNGTTIRKTVDGGTPIPLIGDVSALAFDFYGVTLTRLVRKIGVTITMLDPSDPNITLDFYTDITIRN
jgi:prepilin-type N-terminal cleavage/methylation domain-containing protein